MKYNKILTNFVNAVATNPVTERIASAAMNPVNLMPILYNQDFEFIVKTLT